MMLPITSSMFSHIGYDADSMTLTVRYHPSKKQLAAGVAGDLWEYKNYTAGLPVEPPEEGWGRWFLANIKGKYDGSKVPEYELVDGTPERIWDASSVERIAAAEPGEEF